MTRIELVTLSLPRIRSADWATSAFLILSGCGGRIWTTDLRVMSPTSCQLLHPAMNLVDRGGFEPPKRNAADLQSAPFSHSGTCPFSNEVYYNTSGAFCQALFVNFLTFSFRLVARRSGPQVRQQRDILYYTGILLSTPFLYIFAFLLQFIRRFLRFYYWHQPPKIL